MASVFLLVVLLDILVIRLLYWLYWLYTTKQTNVWWWTWKHYPVLIMLHGNTNVLNHTWSGELVVQTHEKEIVIWRTNLRQQGKQLRDDIVVKGYLKHRKRESRNVKDFWSKKEWKTWKFYVRSSVARDGRCIGKMKKLWDDYGNGWLWMIMVSGNPILIAQFSWIEKAADYDGTKWNCAKRKNENKSWKNWKWFRE